MDNKLRHLNRLRKLTVINFTNRIQNLHVRANSVYISRLSFHFYHFSTVRDHIEKLALTFTQYGMYTHGKKLRTLQALIF